MFRVHVREGALHTAAGHWHLGNPKLTRRLVHPGPCPCLWSSRCQVPHGVYRVLEEVTQALAQGQKLVTAVKVELADILGNVGTNLGMQTLLQSLALCWN